MDISEQEPLSPFFTYIALLHPFGTSAVFFHAEVQFLLFLFFHRKLTVLSLDLHVPRLGTLIYISRFLSC